ncbi:MAG: atpH [Caulobacteraceae bacterium]|nr:atpH [Caulobacteraceae bacterium]
MVCRGRRSNAPGGIKLADDSKQTDVGARYARALFDLALDNKAVEAVENDLKALKAAREESADLRLAIASPVFSAEAKGRALTAIGEKIGFNRITLNFIGVLAANRRASALPAITAAFEHLSAAYRGVVAAEVTTAIKLTAAQAKGVKAALAQALGQEPEITTRVDPTILGGLKVKVGSRLFDASLRSKLDSLKFALKRA